MAHAALALWLAGGTASADVFAVERGRMVTEQIERRGINDAAILRTMRATPRHLFVPQHLRVMAYQDRPLPIGHSATISQPFVVALMTTLLKVRRSDRVLEIGTGSGYQAAVLAQLALHVYTIEIVPELAKSAGERLRRLEYSNIEVRQGDGYKGWPELAPFDCILLTAAPPEIPAALIAQLAKGGRLVAPVGAGWDQELVILEKDAFGALHRRTAGTVTFVPMIPGER